MFDSRKSRERGELGEVGVHKPTGLFCCARLRGVYQRAAVAEPFVNKDPPSAINIYMRCSLFTFVHLFLTQNHSLLTCGHCLIARGREISSAPVASCLLVKLGHPLLSSPISLCEKLAAAVCWFWGGNSSSWLRPTFKAERRRGGRVS